MLERISEACLLAPEDVQPSTPELRVAGAFNPAAADTPQGVMLGVRIAEEAAEDRPGCVGLPRWDDDAGIVIDWISKEKLDLPDPRVAVEIGTWRLRLRFLSHIRIYCCPDGRSIDPEPLACFYPEGPFESYGVEDARFTTIEGRTYMTYVGVSPHGVATLLASTTDFKSFQRHGVIFPCENKDVLLFPERVAGRYMALHRPVPAMMFTSPEIWLASSPDLIHWGNHAVLHGEGAGVLRIGGGCPPIPWQGGWLAVYHANLNHPGYGEKGVYCGGAMLLGKEDPSQILAATREPIMLPIQPYERSGFVNNVVFPTGLADRGDSLFLYYGAADRCTGIVEWSKSGLAAALNQ